MQILDSAASKETEILLTFLLSRNSFSFRLLVLETGAQCQGRGGAEGGAAKPSPTSPGPRRTTAACSATPATLSGTRATPACHTSYPQVRISPNSRHKLFMSGQKTENHERANMSQICVNTSAFAQDIIKRDPQVIMAEQIKRNRDISVRDAFNNRRKFPFLIDFIFEQPQ